MDKLIPLFLAAMANESIRKLVLSFLDRPQEKELPLVIRDDVVAIQLDAAMRERVKAYQTANSLTPDGVPGPKTLGSMLGKLGK
jgi:murein L,D-transpeptidase YcbB/YkuD